MAGGEEEEEEEYVPSAEWTWCKIPFPHPLGWLPEATSSRACEDLWDQLPRAGQCHCSEVSLLRLWGGSWWLVLPPWREQMSLCRGAAQPSHTALRRGSLEEVAQGGFGGGWPQPCPPACGPSEALATSGRGD